MARQLLMDVHVVFNGEIVSLNGAGGEVTMIPFAGTVEGPLFRGVVEPCGVDTQRVDAAGVRHLSARYMLTGADAEGNPARIFVENNGWYTGGELAWPFHTVPAFVTDSPRLAEQLNRPGIVGEGSQEADGLHIRFYAPGGED